jgi:pimeloyl-ACP methyl ester carboxylesterase
MKALLSASWRLIVVMMISTLSGTQAQQVTMEQQKTTGYAPVNGLKMYYEIYGSGDLPLVLIHGGGSTIETTFSNILPKLAAFTKIIAVELQAHGRTSDRDAPESFMQDADDVAALLRYLKVGKANVLGFSDGGCTTMQLAGRHPELINKIVVVASNYTRAGMIDGFFEMMDNASLDNMPAPLKEWYLKANPDPKGLQNMFNKDRERRRTFADWPESDLTRIQAPALIITGDKDVIKTEHIVEISKLIPQAQLVILPGVHGALLGEICTVKAGSQQPEITATLVKEFLGE